MTAEGVGTSELDTDVTTLDEPHYKFKTDTGVEVLLNMPKGVFLPTGTTTSLVKAVRTYVSKPGVTLDLGCGSGVVGIALYKMGLVKEPLYASDSSEKAFVCMNRNAKFHKCPVLGKCGSLFEPWKNRKFDYIVNDVSGVAKDVAKVSPWFDGVSCQSGIDGTLLVIEVLQKAPNHLNPEGLLFFPVISLSNTDNILSMARKNFSHVKQLLHQEWPLPKEMYQHLAILKRLQKQGHIQIEEKFGMVLWFTDTYVAYD